MRLRKQAVVVAVAALLSGVAIAAGCSLVTSYEGFTPTAGALPCPKSIPPRNPSAPGGGNKTLVGTMNFVRFFAQGDASDLGYDLDNLCTCPGRGACRSKKEAFGGPCDLPAGSGADNSIGQILKVLYPSARNEDLIPSIQAGRFGVVVRIQGWNGLRDDADVAVSLFNAVGVNGKSDGTGRATFDGNDGMIVDRSSLLAAVDFGSKYYDTSAYVTGGLLVAKLDFDFRLEIPNALIDASSVSSVPLRPAFFIGRIQPVGEGGLKMTDAQLVGRIPAKDVFGQLSGIGLCQDSGFYEPVKQQTCEAMDLPTDPAQTGKDVACDALSFAIGVSIVPAKLGGIGDAPPAARLCGDEATDDCR
ncbi:MAG: hypothetical protein KF819_12305 [Labilithrix sp.]|nr:hypothetical protein [Labilithrix sp.]